MHPILNLAPARPPEYHRGLAQGLQLALHQLHLLAHCKQSIITTSSLKALHRRLDAVCAAIRAQEWTKADALLSHAISPPLPLSERGTHTPFMGRAAAQDNAKPPCENPSLQMNPFHHRRSR